MGSGRRDPRGPWDIEPAILMALATGLAAAFVESLSPWLAFFGLALLFLFLTARRFLDTSRSALGAIRDRGRAFFPVRSRVIAMDRGVPEGARRLRNRLKRPGAVITTVVVILTLAAVAGPLIVHRPQVSPDDPTVVACFEDLHRDAKATLMKSALVAEPGGAVAACRSEWPAAFGHAAPDNLVNCVLSDGGQAVFPGRGFRTPDEVCAAVDASPTV